jgi:type IV secretory pathway VirB2 component (pilin)
MFSMKKLSIFLSLLFIFLISPALSGQSDANANSCVGTATGSGLTLADGALCSSITDEQLCRNENGGCNWSVSSSADDNKLTDTLCNALQIVTGSGGKAFAAFAIISVGIGFFTGKVSWGLMIGVSAGIAAMFGAPTIVAAISGEDAVDCSS